jgi:hypothetical protein
LTEFLSLWAFETDEIVIPCFSVESGTVFPDEKMALKANNIACSMVRVPKTTSASTILYLPKIENDIQDKTVRLYRIARSHNDVYSQALFFWHTIIYPSAKEENAQKYIQEFVDKNISECKHVYEDIDRLIKFNVYGKKINKSNFGQHIREDIRHAIAHIVRTNDSGSLEIDNRMQQNYIAGISRILRYISRYKIENNHGLSLEKSHSADYFTTIPSFE